MKAAERIPASQNPFPWAANDKAMLRILFMRGARSTDASSGTYSGHIIDYITEHSLEGFCVDDVLEFIPSLDDTELQVVLGDISYNTRKPEEVRNSSILLSLARCILTSSRTFFGRQSRCQLSHLGYDTSWRRLLKAQPHVSAAKPNLTKVPVGIAWSLLPEAPSKFIASGCGTATLGAITLIEKMEAPSRHSLLSVL